MAADRIIVCPEYRGYSGQAVYDTRAKLYHGYILFIDDVVTFQGRIKSDAIQAFQASVDDYLEFCAERGEEPERPRGD